MKSAAYPTGIPIGFLEEFSEEFSSHLFFVMEDRMKEFRRRISSTNPPNLIGQKDDWPNHNNNNNKEWASSSSSKGEPKKTIFISGFFSGVKSFLDECAKRLKSQKVFS